MSGRKKYQRPQAMLWADNSGTVTDNGFYIPNGAEVGSQDYPNAEGSFIILSDDNREPIDFSIERIEKRERMINGRMRSYHIADKLTIATSWQMLPSRSYGSVPDFDATGATSLAGNRSAEFTTDGGAGGVAMLDWYKNHQGSFWVYLAYDNYSNFGSDDAALANNLNRYNEVVEVFFSDFKYSVQKRGGSNYDFWNISVTLEEV